MRAGGVTVLAKPPVRKLAKEHGVDLSLLQGTGPGGTITRADVEAVVRTRGRLGTPRSRSAAAHDVQAARDAACPSRGVRKHTAAAMVASAFTAPHVTEFLTLDITPDDGAAVAGAGDARVRRGQGLAAAVRRQGAAAGGHAATRRSTAAGTRHAQEIVVKHYVNLGIAAATPRGLLVPNVKDADQLSLPELGPRAAGAGRDGARGPHVARPT